MFKKTTDQNLVYLSFANVVDNPMSLLTEESHSLFNILAPLVHRGVIRLYRDEFATEEKIISNLNRFMDRLVIFHYSGFAGRDSLSLSQDGGAGNQTFIRLLGQQANNLKLVFLNGAANYAQVQALLKVGVKAVLATSVPIEDPAGMDFSRFFYESLARSYSIRESFELAMASIQSKYGYGDKEIGNLSYKTLREGNLNEESSFKWGLYLYSDVEAELLEWKISGPDPTSSADPASGVSPEKTVDFDKELAGLIRQTKEKLPTGSVLKESLGHLEQELQVLTEKYRGKDSRILLNRRIESLFQEFDRVLPNQNAIALNDTLRKEIGELVFQLELNHLNTKFDHLVYQIEHSKEVDVETSRGIVLRKMIRGESGKYYAIIIGIGKYDNHDDLEHPLEEARKIKELLEKNYLFEKIIFVENPTHDDILDAIDELREEVNKGDNLFVYYAGHGHWDEDSQQGWWLAKDSEKNLGKNWLDNAVLQGRIKFMKQFQHVLVISDSCFSGAMLGMRDASLQKAEENIKTLYLAKSRQVLTSGAKEVVPDKSVFFEHLYKFLENNEEGFISSQNIFSAIRDNVINNSRTRQKPQWGKILDAGDDGGDFIFVRKTR